MLKKIILIVLIISIRLTGQDFHFAHDLYNSYDDYKEKTLNERRIKHADILPLIEQLKDKNIFTVNKAGESAEGRDILIIKSGNGKIPVLFWSQMHGDEPTATQALFDMFNFFSADDHFNEIRKKIFDKMTLYFIPMLNPDGAEYYKRRTLWDIDMNRDALRIATPEAVILKDAIDNLKPKFGFNLHDQSTRYTAGNSPLSAAISFLAPPFDPEKNINEVRERSMKMIVELDEILSQFIPGHIAKYSDDFEARAFGDNIQKWGTSAILVESGGWKDDPEKQFIRKLNYLLMLSALKSICDESYTNQNIDDYYLIPDNETRLMNVIMRNLTVNSGDFSYIADVGINYSESTIGTTKQYFYSNSVSEIGDLSTFYGYNDYDFDGYEILPGTIDEKVYSTMEELSEESFQELYKLGYTYVKVDETVHGRFTEIPINVISGTREINFREELRLGIPANFVIKKNEDIKFVVINGFIYNVLTGTGEILNGIIYR